MEKQRHRSRKKKKAGIKLWAGIAGGTVLVAAAAVTAAYISIGRQYQSVFFPNTTINGVDASQRSVEEVKRLIASGIEGYTLTVEERGGSTDLLKGVDIGLEAVFDGSLEKLLEEQEPGDWIRHRRESQNFEISTMIQYDEGRFLDVVSDLNCFDEENVIDPVNAYISDYVSGGGYSIVPAVEGTKLIKEAVERDIADAVTNLKSRISLEELEAYEKPDIESDDPVLVSQLESLKKLTGVTVTYTFGDQKEVLDGDILAEWIGFGEDGQPYVSSGKITEYVKELASEYDTYNRAKYLDTSYGKQVRITGGSYGWRINQAAEADALAAIINSGESQTREPIYKQTAASHGPNDYGNTYVEINLTAQHLFYYKDGKKLIDSDFVSGNESKGWGTPAGVYPLTYKERNATLKGENYRTPVDYWMPFNGNIGLHDATWRSDFGGSLFKTSGSHGCVNLPHSAAQTIYENISSGTPVLCYYLEGTESKTTTNPAGKAQPATTAPTAAPSATESPTSAVTGTDAGQSTAPETAGGSSGAGSGTSHIPETSPVAETSSGPETSPVPEKSPVPETSPVPGTSPVPETSPQAGPAGSGGESKGQPAGPGVSAKGGGETEVGPGM